jgi:hypothetical protein
MTHGETGLETLLDAGRVPATPHYPEVASWEELLARLRALRDELHDYRTLVIDTLNGAERMCQEHVCRFEFGGNWGRDGFGSYGAGYDRTAVEWRGLLDLLDGIRQQRRMAILLLCHTRVATYKNPAGPDYDRYTPDLHTKVWGVTHKWADFVLFLTFETCIESSRGQGRPKATGGSRRVLYTTRSAAHDAKNRHGLPEEIDGGDSAAEAWNNLAAAMRAARSKPSGADAGVPQSAPDGANV